MASSSKRAHDGDDPHRKKPRFDARNPSRLAAAVDNDDDEDGDGGKDAILALDEIGKGGRQTKRSAVNLDGYESDSSTENFDTRAQERADAIAASGKQKKNKSKDEEEADMFADLAEDSDEADDAGPTHSKGKAKNKAVRFIDEADIEGQITSSKAGGHVSANFKGDPRNEADSSSSSDESVDEEQRDELGSDVDAELGAGAKKKHAPKLDAFNMRAEGDEGKFDASGNFVRNAADPNAVHDAWLSGLSKRDMKRAKAAQEQREQEGRAALLADDAVLTADILATLIRLLEPGETVLESLQRLQRAKRTSTRQKKPKWHKNKRKQTANGDADTEMLEADKGGLEEDEAETHRKRTVESITEAADRLLGRGRADIYEEEREVLMRQFQRETGEAWTDTSLSTPFATNADGDDDDHAVAGQANGGGAGRGSTAPRQWEYRWADGRDGGERHGPYDGGTMAAWEKAGYFGEGVEFRAVSSSSGSNDWSRIAEFD